jgi:molecular chaperone GrpE
MKVFPLNFKKEDLVRKTMIDSSAENKQNAEKQKENEAAPGLKESAPELEDAKKQIEYYKDLLLRKAAEFENYKRRTENETASVFKYANGELLEELLPIMDDFERSLKHGRENTEYDALLKGIEMIYQKFSKLLEGRGVKSFPTEGKEFNVDFHDALMQVHRTNIPPHTVIQEVEKGYMLNDKVLRHAKVVVSSASAEEPAETPEDEEI